MNTVQRATSEARRATCDGQRTARDRYGVFILPPVSCLLSSSWERCMV